MEVSLLTGGTNYNLETVRVLHETILALRTALEGSQKELNELREKARFSSELTLRSHIKNGQRRVDIGKKVVFSSDSMDDKEEDSKQTDIELQSDDQDGCKEDSEAESDDIDDIELVFTTGETDPSSIHEDLVPIIQETKKRSLTNSVVVGTTDISKCGVLEETGPTFSGRRNTLPNPLPYQPMIHREIFAATRKAPFRSPCKALLPGTQDTSAQTDITALPAQWKSETYLAHKMNCNLTTLPSKFTLPVPQAKRLPLSDKTCEARRILLSDINFTSMVPELSRSADHLHDDKGPTKNQTSALDYIKSPKTEKRCEYACQDSRSSCGSYYGSRCHTSSTSIQPFVYEENRRRHSWKTPHIYCCRSKHYFWSSVPSSPIKCTHEMNEESVENIYCIQPRRRRTKVHFCSCDPCGQSMPNLRMEGDSGESTDSLLDETEEFIRRSIDKMIIGTNRLKKERRFSDTEPTSRFEPPNTAQPFLPKSIKELKRDCLVKVISPAGRVVMGRVRYSGLVPGRMEPYVGVELANNVGFSDGTFMGHHFFDW
ncbi:hypothetical protein RUM43_002208 [Polyplax serrata]|uniref:CAP-Gly domain-containing protein n=1 Tax=Polyplax serrata TaxID=468196 RepID=A0AAN8NYX9_POLSC